MKAPSSYWRQKAGAVLTALLLLPVPAYAAFTGFTWGTVTDSSGGTLNPFLTPSFTGTTGTKGMLTLTVKNPPPTYNTAEIWSITATLTTTDGNINGSWTGLNAFQNIGGFLGNVNVNVTATDQTIVSNMFGTAPILGGTNYNVFNPAPASANLTQASGLSTSAQTTVTIRFRINAGTTYTSSTGSTIQLILQ